MKSGEFIENRRKAALGIYAGSERLSGECRSQPGSTPIWR